MKRLIKQVLVISAIALSCNLLGQTKNIWEVDQSHSALKFSVIHLLISEVEGNFKIFQGQMRASTEDFSDAEIDFSADVASVDTDNEMRDGHLQSDDFFNTATYPKMTFVSKSFKKMANDQYALTGDLTIRDITKEVTLDVKYGGNIQDPYGNTKAGFKATGAINRFDYGLKWNALTEAGGAVASEEVALTLNLEFKLAK